MFGGTYETNNQEFKTLPLGEYLTVLDNLQMDETKEKRTPYINLKLKIVDGDFKNRYIFHKLWLTEKACGGVTANQLDLLGCFQSIKPTESLDEFSRAAFDNLTKILNKKIKFKITDHNEYNGEIYESGWIAAFADVPNLAWQKFPVGNEPVAASEPSFDAKEEIPF